MPCIRGHNKGMENLDQNGVTAGISAVNAVNFCI